MITASKIKKIVTKKKKEFLCEDYAFGLRGDDRDFRIGDDCYDSSDPAGENLRGTCSIEVTENMPYSEIEKRIEEANRYGKNVYLICGDDWGKGEDKNERIIHAAEIIEVVE